MQGLVINFEEEGFEKVFTPYQELVWRILWENPDRSYTTKEMWAEVNQRLGSGSISRASIINFMQDMAEQGVLIQELETCKGGMRGLYKPKMDEPGLKRHIVETVLNTLRESFPSETDSSLGKFK
jgi:predicted transcriptional regulator